MSYGRECEAEYAYEIEQAQSRWELVCERVQNLIVHRMWCCKDGRLMSVEDMTTSHIQNCINMLERNNNPFKKDYIQMFNNELERRQDEHINYKRGYARELL